MLSLTIPPSRSLWIEGRKSMAEGKFEDSINYLHGALIMSPPGDSEQKFVILLDLGYSIAVAYDDLYSATPLFEKAFAMVNSAPDVSSKAQLYNNLAHCYLEELIDEIDLEKKSVLGYQALACAGIARDCYFHINNKKGLYSTKELEEEIKSEMNDWFDGCEF